MCLFCIRTLQQNVADHPHNASYLHNEAKLLNPRDNPPVGIQEQS